MAEPASTIITKLGGTATVARQLSLAQSTVLRWTMPKDKGGTGGLIPSKHQAALIEVGAAPQDFFRRSQDAA